MKKWEFWIDVGGTFTDCVARDPQGRVVQHKTLSSGVVKGRAEHVSESRPLAEVKSDRENAGQFFDPARAQDPDDVWVGHQLRLASCATPCEITRFRAGQFQIEGKDAAGFQWPTTYEVISPEPAPLVAIRYLLGARLRDALPPIALRLGTTRGTNALITRSGSRTALVATRGFRDVLRIGYQSRPDLFAQDIKKPDELYESVVEVRERIGANGEILSPVDAVAARSQLERLREQGVSSLAIVLLHACANPVHEVQLGQIAKDLGFANVSVSHETSSRRKLVPRGDTTVLDAYLNPILESYIASIRSALHPDSEFHLMTSAGGLAESHAFRGKDSILSGPAGGVVGVAHVAQTLGRTAALGFDMGGTSTDVSRWSAGDDGAGQGDFDLEFENEKAGQRIATPMMAIETVAAGGGSLCKFDGVKFTVGPESAGADPGPACYGRGGPLAITDMNFYLGRIPESAFPFPLDYQAVQQRLERQAGELYKATGTQMSPEEVAAGYLRIANTGMAEAIRCVSVQRGVDPRDELLVAFGGAAAQHACAVAEELGMREIAIHRNAGILSAMGIGMARVTIHEEIGVYQKLSAMDQANLDTVFARLENQTKEKLPVGRAEAICGPHVEFRRYLDLRFVGLDATLRIPEPASGDYTKAYLRAFHRRSGYLPKTYEIECVTARVTASLSDQRDQTGSRIPETVQVPVAEREQESVFGGRVVECPVYARTSLAAGDTIQGPAIITEAISTIVIDPGWTGRVATGGELLLTRETTASEKLWRVGDRPDPILLEVFNKRFTAIATQMGATLRNIARSVNVKERLDFSCAIFTAAGQLVVNAPHIPVHLGAMGATVRDILEHMDLQPGDVIASNDPYRGGSHLPDVTVVTPVHNANGNLLFLTASRAHHAEIGGKTPGSMPAFSTNLAEEGKLIRRLKLIDGGVSCMADVESLLRAPEYPSRDPELNVADLAAQIAANRLGAELLLGFVADYSWATVSTYMSFIQEAAEQKTRNALRRLSGGQRYDRRFVDHLDDGTPICVRFVIDDDQAVVDFSGTGPTSRGNFNANPAIVTAATLYCLRLLIAEDIPLNDGVLKPVQLIIPEGLLNPPWNSDMSRCPAVVGGNVETSQRIVDVVLGAMGIAAASQGTMNNLLFGDSSFGYYETICGGAGATEHAPGADAVHTHMTNTRLTDPEVLEQRFPVRLRCFEIRAGSGGRGMLRGGNGVVREIEFLKQLQVSLLTQRRGEFAPYGIEGGSAGSTGMNRLIRGDSETNLSGSAQIQVRPGDILRIETPGGGGFGKAPTE